MQVIRTAWFKLFIVVGVSLIASIQARAQPLFGHAESIESTVANADLVLVGKLVEFSGAKTDARQEHEATIAVESTLKENIFTGQPYQRLRVQVRYPVSVLSDWKDHSNRLLVAVMEDTPAEAKLIDLAQPGLEVVTANFTLLRDPEGVIRAARETVRRMPAPVRRIHTFGLQVPREAVAGTKWEHYYPTGGSLILSVPVDKRLEERAHDYVRSESYEKREEGARALRYFKSDENIARVRTLLNDPGWAYVYHAQENKGTEVRIYGVRQEAYRTLRSWGLAVAVPMIREEIHK